MSYISSLEKAILYIEANLHDEIDLTALAKEAGYSLYHFHRVFKWAVGDSIKEYIRKRRITEAAKELSSSDRPIIDIAVKYGYQSREAFSRAFEKIYGRNPSQFRDGDLFYYIREAITYDYLLFEYQRRKQGMQPKFIKLPLRYVVGNRYKMDLEGNNYQEIPLLWQKWHKKKTWMQIEGTKYNDQSLGICIFGEDTNFDYMIGCEVETPDHIPHGMDLYELQPALYAVFRTIGPITESVQKTWDYIYAIWLNESGYSHAGTHDIEHYFCIEDELVADLYVPVIRKDY